MRISRYCQVAMAFLALVPGPDSAAAPLAYPACGSVNAEPVAPATVFTSVRLCGPVFPRRYIPKHKGIGFDALDLESEVCFVGDESYRLLDEIIDAVLARVGTPLKQGGQEARIARVLNVSRTTGQVLLEKGFVLVVPTQTLGDALADRGTTGQAPRHVTDCDTSSLILLTVAEAANLPASLVEITLEGGVGHNFVRWEIGQEAHVDWDTNGRMQCSAPANSPPFQGMSMSRDQVTAYLLALRAQLREQVRDFTGALQDYQDAVARHPEHHAAYNNFVWAVATKDFRGRKAYEAVALQYTDKLLSILRSPNTLDTAACMQAFAGAFSQAETYEAEALKGDPGNPALIERLGWFRSVPPRDCTGAP